MLYLSIYIYQVCTSDRGAAAVVCPITPDNAGMDMPGLRLIASSNCATKFKPMNAPDRQCKQIYIAQYMVPILMVPILLHIYADNVWPNRMGYCGIILTAISSSMRLTLSRGLIFCHSLYQGQVRSCRYLRRLRWTTLRATRCSCSFLKPLRDR